MAMAVPATVADASVKINCPVCDVSSWFKVPYDSQVQSALEVFGENIEAICPFCSAKLYVHANDILPSLNEVEILPDEEGEAESHNICCGRCIIDNVEIVDEVITIRFNDEYEYCKSMQRDPETNEVSSTVHEHGNNPTDIGSSDVHQIMNSCLSTFIFSNEKRIVEDTTPYLVFWNVPELESINAQFDEVALLLEAENSRSVQEIAHERSGEYKELDYIFRERPLPTHKMYQHIETGVELTGDNPIHALRKGRKFDVVLSAVHDNFALMVLGDIDEYGKFVEKLTFMHSSKYVHYKGYTVRMVTGYYKTH